MRQMRNANGSGIKPGTFKRLMAYLFSHYRAHLITVMVCIIITAVASVGQTIYIQALIDQCILLVWRTAWTACGRRWFPSLEAWL